MSKDPGSTRDDPIVLLDPECDGGEEKDGRRVGGGAAALRRTSGVTSGAGRKSGGSARRPICVDSEDDDAAAEDRHRRKRPADRRPGGASSGATTTKQRPGATKRARSEIGTTSAAVRGDVEGDDLPPNPPFAPFRLLATLPDERDGRPFFSSRLSRHCLTLRELIGLDGPDARSLGPIRYVVIANFMIDFEFLLDYAPELLSVQRAVVFYGVSSGRGGVDAGPNMWKSAMGDRVDLVPLVPSDRPRLGTNPLPFRVPFGVHHTKLFLVGFDSCVRVVVHTANLIHSGVHLNANGAYVQDFPLKSTLRADGCSVVASSSSSTAAAAAAASSAADDDDDESSSDEDESYLLSCPFEEALASYLETYRYTRRSLWPTAGSRMSAPQTLVELARRYDYNSAFAVLIPSVPGRYRVAGCPWGYLRLRKAVRDYCAPAPAAGGGGDGDAGEKNAGGPVVCQFSSMGSLTNKWLHEFASAVDVGTCRRADPPQYPGRSSLSSSAPTAASGKLRLVWPTVEEVRTSIQGYAGGDCVPGTVKNVTKPFLRPLYHRWRSAANGAGGDPTRKGRCVPHIKTYLQLSSSSPGAGGGGGGSIEWMVLTSHNLSRAAWGEVQNGVDGPKLFMRHWELGVFFSPRLLEDAALADAARGVATEEGRPFPGRGRGTSRSAGAPPDCRGVRMEPFRGKEEARRGGSGSSASGGDHGRHPGDAAIVVPLPFPFDAVETVPYGPQDVPWTVDRRYDNRPDSFGRCSCYDP